MKVLFIARKLPPQTKVYAIHNYIKCFVEDGNTAYYLSDREYPLNIHVNQKIKLNYNSKLGKLILTFENIKKIIHVIRTFKPEIIHIEQTIAFPMIYFIVEIQDRKIKTLLDIRTLPNTKIKTIYYIFISKFIKNIVALNKHILATLQINNQSILPLGYDPDIFFSKKDLPTSSNLVKIKKIIYFGAISKNRNISNLIAQISKTLLKNKDIIFYIIGKGTGMAELNDYIDKNNLKSTVKALDPMTQAELSQYIREADLCLSWIPNDAMHNPNIPLKTIESMASGTPVLATDTIGNREIIKNDFNGFIVPEERYSQKLSSIITDGYNVNILKECRNTVKKLTWRNLYKSHLKTYYKHLISP